MSTQHPDNVTIPFFSDQSTIQGETEVKEAYYAFSHLDCREQMWDYEGKEVDAFVIEKLLSKYDYFFKEKVIGKDIFITLRVPNPAVEKSEGKILLETLESIPRNYDIANRFYPEVAPIFEVILPMTVSHLELQRIYNYYKKIVVGKGSEKLVNGDITISKWTGEFKPDEINVIPLFENAECLLDANKILERYLKAKRVDYQRAFLARSDPALNYGAVSAVLLNKIALQRLHTLEEKISIQILPIIGVGSAPFRGNLKPTNVPNCATEYPSVQTFTIQSAFKYDYPEEVVRLAVEQLNETKRKNPLFIDEEIALRIINKVKKEYTLEIMSLYPLINQISKYVPSRRSRKLHIGLFGYSRNFEKVKLPRAIPFCASLYSIGLPPEMLGLGTLNEKELELLSDAYVKFEEDLRDALQFFNKNNLKYLPRLLQKKLAKVQTYVDYAADEQHEKATSYIMNLIKKENFVNLREEIEKTAHIRRFLG